MLQDTLFRCHKEFNSIRCASERFNYNEFAASPTHTQMHALTSYLISAGSESDSRLHTSDHQSLQR